MKQISLLTLALVVVTGSLLAQTKPACAKLAKTFAAEKFEISNSDGMTAKNFKLVFNNCKATYTFDMMAEGEGGSMELSFSFEDVISIEKVPDEGFVKVSLYEGKEANSKLKAGGETMEEKTADVPFKFPADKLDEMYELIKAAVKECNEAFLDLD